MSDLTSNDLVRLLDEVLTRVESTERVTAGLADHVKSHDRTLTALEQVVAARGKTGKPKIDPTTVKPWAETADATAWAVLAEWVDWLVETYAPRPGIPACWPAHGGLVEELAALHSWWISARHETSRGPSEAMGYWHDRGLAPLLNRLSTTYKITSCETTGHKAPAKPITTDEHLFAQATNHTTTQNVDPATGEIRVDP